MDEDERRGWWIRWRHDFWEVRQAILFVEIRNLSAHHALAHTVTPVQSAQALRAVADFVNGLWPQAHEGNADGE